MATNTVATKQTHTAANNSGGNTSGPYAISFDYLDQTDVEVRVDNVLKTQTTHYTFPSKTSILFTSGNFPTAGATIEIKRNTNITVPKVDFEDGSVLTETDLDNNSKHLLFGMQETKEDVEGLVSSFVGASAPTGSSIVNGARWYDTVSGRTFIYYVDTDSAQWVEANPPFDASNATTSASGFMSTADKTKLDGIEVGSTADQTAAEIRTLVESATDSNVFTDADHTKLNGIEVGSTADQTASEIKTLLNSDGIVNAQIDASAAIAGTKISPDFGSQNVVTTGSVTTTGIVGSSIGITVNNTDQKWSFASDGSLLWTGHSSFNFNSSLSNGYLLANGFSSKAGIGTSVAVNNAFNIYWTSSAAQLFIDTTNLGTISVSSDYRIKKDITTQTASGIDKIKQLRPVNYEYTDNTDLSFKGDGVKREGFIAHEVAEIIPSAVDGEKDATNQVQSLRVDAIVSVLTKALQEAVVKIEVLEAKVASLEG